MTGLYTRTIPFKNACTEIGWYPVANADLRVLVDFVRFFFCRFFRRSTSRPADRDDQHTKLIKHKWIELGAVLKHMCLFKMVFFSILNFSPTNLSREDS